MHLIALGEQSGTKGTEGESRGCDGDKPLCVEVNAGCIKVGFDFSRGESEVFVSFSND
jgi:hypothetical protein